MASGQTRLQEMFRARATSRTAHERLWSLFLDYTFVGGMPEAVAAWFDAGRGMAQRISDVETIHGDLVAGFERDFGKYAGPLHAQHIDAVFHNIPAAPPLCRAAPAEVRLQGLHSGEFRAD